MPKKGSAERFMLTKEKEAELAGLAEFIADKYFPSSVVEPAALAEINNITYSYNHYGNAFDGLLEYDCELKEFHIYNDLDRVISPTSTRARFTFAHELGHFYIDEHRNSLMGGVSLHHGSKCDYESKLTVEQEADFFASCLLMPPTRFNQAAKNKSIGFDSIFKICNIFNSSISSTAVRYVSLDIAPCILFKWNSKGQLNWSWASQNFKTANFGYSYKKGIMAQLIKGSATERVLNGETSSELYIQSGTTISTWFPKINAPHYKNQILIEQSLSLGQFGVMTLLFPDRGNFDFETKRY